jgi:hypothetical protein
MTRVWKTCRFCLRALPPDTDCPRCAPVAETPADPALAVAGMAEWDALRNDERERRGLPAFPRPVDAHECMSPGCRKMTVSALCEGCHERYMDAQS